MKNSVRLDIKGIVQGVGFRPFVYRIANKFNLNGYVLNHGSGVTIEVQGNQNDIDLFIKNLAASPPAHSKINSINIELISALEYSNFRILESISSAKSLSISPDLGICADCKNELLNPSNRRHYYPFITCSECGPRYTILNTMPFDRENTSMSEFEMCEKCKNEYANPNDRRFHAETISCEDCGPKLKLIEVSNECLIHKDINNYKELIEAISKLLKDGKIIAIKSIGGYHLACSAFSEKAMLSLRNRKNRNSKPFAVMFKDIEEVRKYAYCNDRESAFLSETSAPIVLLKKKKDTIIHKSVSAKSPYIGAILPYTPIHELILNRYNDPIVMTSCNISDDSIIYKDSDALHSLINLADYLLTHNREIQNPCEDSLLRELEGNKFFIRKSRGFIPGIGIKQDSENSMEFLCVGAELKNSISLVKNNSIIPGPFNGDLKVPEVYKIFESQILKFESFFDLKPSLIAHDLHPEYLNTLWAINKASNLKIQSVGIQHHHSHIASCLGDNDFHENAIGVALDGTGYGTDKNIWGGEFFVSNRKESIRKFSFYPIPLAGGEKAIEEPWRIAVACLKESGFSLEDIFKLPIFKTLEHSNIIMIYNLLNNNLRTIYASSCGRLFDSVSALIGVCENSDYDGQAAIELEYALYEHEIIKSKYNYFIDQTNNLFDWRPMIKDIVKDIINNCSTFEISSKFHNTLIAAVTDICKIISEETSIKTIALSGGCFLNKYLLENTIAILRKNNFAVLYHKDIPTSDSGISFGQAITIIN